MRLPKFSSLLWRSLLTVALLSFADAVSAQVARLPVVGIIASRPDTAEPSPTSRIAPGEFVIHRTGSPTNDLIVFLAYQGTATAEKDYESLPRTVTIPAGTNEVRLLVQPVADQIEEGDETVVAHILPPLTLVPTYEIDPAAESATVVIHDAPATSNAKITITHPPDGAKLPLGVDVDVTAVAVDPDGYIPKVEFYLDGSLLDVSIIYFFRAPDPGTPVQHHVTWKNPTPGDHILTARGEDSHGRVVESTPVHVTVEGGSSGTVVAIAATDPVGTKLPPIVSVIDPLQFAISRTGSTEAPLTVFFSLHGTAIAGTDYRETPRFLVIPAGEMSATLTIAPYFGTKPGLMKTLGVRLEASPLANALSNYDIDPASSEAAGVIYELTPPNVPVVELVFPSNGEQIDADQDVRVIAATFRPELYIPHLDYYDGETKIGSSDVAIDPLPGSKPPSLVFHHFTWKSPNPGEHTLSARAILADGTLLKSAPVTVDVRGSTGSEAHIEITAPRDGETFALGAPIPITAVAIDPAGYIPRVDFYADDRFIGVSEIVFIRPPDPGTPITHHFIWTNAPAGTHVLTARGVDSHHLTITSPPVKILVQSDGGMKVTITAPVDGAVFTSGTPIVVRATAMTPMMGTKRLELIADGNLLTSTDGSVLEYRWTNASEGPHTLVARAIQGGGGSVDSAPVRILVEKEAELKPFVFRKLPAGYAPGQIFQVKLVANPPVGTLAYALEDTPPKGWTVSAVTDDGVFDSVTGKVKFGPFTSGDAKTLSYSVSAPNSATGTVEFAGTASASGTSTPIAGDHLITQNSRLHPADVNSDQRIDLNELTSYAAAWKSASSLSIPLSYVTRAGYLWKHGEKYHYDETQPAPLCWVTDELRAVALGSESSFTATRSLMTSTDGSRLDCTISVVPPSGSAAYGIEETLPAGCTAADVSDGGLFDAASGTIRWGLFLDGAPRDLHYSLAAAGPTDLTQLHGVVSSDGEKTIEIGMIRPNVACLAHGNGALRLKLGGLPGRVYILESSSDLLTWKSVQPLYLPSGELDYSAADSSTNRQVFYRLRLP